MRTEVVPTRHHKRRRHRLAIEVEEVILIEVRYVHRGIASGVDELHLLT